LPNVKENSYNLFGLYLWLHKQAGGSQAKLSGKVCEVEGLGTTHKKSFQYGYDNRGNSRRLGISLSGVSD